MPIIYPDIEKVLVAYLKDSLGSDVRVGTVKLGPDSPLPAKQVVVTVSWASTKEVVTRYAGVQVECFADTYEDASELGLTVDAVLRTATVGPIKAVFILAGPIRFADESGQEKRAISAEVVVQATDL